MGALGLQGSYNIMALNNATREIYQHHMLGLNDLNMANLQLVEAGKSLRSGLLTQDPKQREEFLDDLAKRRAAFAARMDTFQKSLTLDDMKLKTNALMEECSLAARQQDVVVELMRKRQQEAAVKALELLNSVNKRRNQLMGEIVADKLAVMKKAADQVEAAAQGAMLTSAIVLVVAVSLALFLGVTIARTITRPLGKMVDVARLLAAGDVDQTIAVQSEDETGELAHAFSALIASIKGLTMEMGGLVEAARQGQVDRRGDETKFNGSFRELVRGINETLNAFEAPVQEASATLARVAQRDLTARMEGDYRGDFAAISNSLNTAVVNLRGALVEVRQSADGVTATADGLSAASEQISSGAQEQAASLEEMSASLQQMTATVKQNAENARQASQLAAGSRAAAEQGGEIVANAVAAMGEINQSSRQIGDIIGTIDEIAFQTNLLALNAAVEAARAGEQGRGFAVVAAEVRSLAQRSATAAREIKGLIQNSLQKVENGSQLVNRSGQALVEIVQSVKRVTDLMSEIAAASVEQSSGIDQVNTATLQLNQVTQANASQTEQMSSTAESLSSSATQLQGLVSQFDLGSEEGQRSTGNKLTRTTKAPGPPSAKRYSVEGNRKSSALDSLARSLDRAADHVLKGA